MRRESRERVAPTTTGDNDASTSTGNHASHLHHQYPTPSLLFSNPLSLSRADSPGHRRRGKRSSPPATATTTGFWLSDVTPTTKDDEPYSVVPWERASHWLSSRPKWVLDVKNNAGVADTSPVKPLVSMLHSELGEATESMLIGKLGLSGKSETISRSEGEEPDLVGCLCLVSHNCNSTPFFKVCHGRWTIRD